MSFCFPRSTWELLGFKPTCTGWELFVFFRPVTSITESSTLGCPPWYCLISRFACLGSAEVMLLYVRKATKYKGWSRPVMTSAWLCPLGTWPLSLHWCYQPFRNIYFPWSDFPFVFPIKKKNKKKKWKGSFIAIKLQRSWWFYACAA